MPIRRPTVVPRPRAVPRAALGLAALALLVAGCAAPSPSAEASPSASLSSEAAALPRLGVKIAGRDLVLAGYDPSWPPELGADQRSVLRLAPYLQLARGATYPIALTFLGNRPPDAWLPPDFGYAGGSAPAGTESGLVAQVPTSALVRSDALVDFEAGLFGVSTQGASGPVRIAYPVWIQLPDTLPPDAFSGFTLGIADEDQEASSLTFIAHVQEDLRRGGGPAAKTYPTRAELMADYDAGRLDAFISIPKGWSSKPTTKNGFESGSKDPVNGNRATDTGDSYLLGSLIVRALGPAGLIYDRGY